LKSSISALWSANSVAIIGATERAGAMGRLPLEYLQKYGFAGDIFPVNPKGGKILGLEAFASVKDVGKKIELALIMVPANFVKEAVQDCADAKVGVAIVMSSGFAEADEAGAIAQDELLAIAKGSGMRLVGPNCIGSAGGTSKLAATFSPVFSGPSTPLESGNIALVSQSGALGYGIYSLAVDRSLPIGIVVTTGNEADVTALEVAATLAEDKNIDAILMYAESLADVKALREIAKMKPTAILKSGRSAAGAEAAASHTGALATEDRVIDAAINSSGAVRVDDVEHLLDAGSIFASKVSMTGNRVAIITTSGGSGILGTDALEKHGLTLAKLSAKTTQALDEIVPSYGNTANPVDVTAAVMSAPDLFEKCVEVLAKDSEVDAIVATFCVLVGSDVERIANALSAVRGVRDIPVVVARTGSQSLAPEADRLFKAAKLPVFPTPERAVRALQTLRIATKPAHSVERKPLCKALATPADQATEDQLKSALASVGVPVPLSVVVENLDEALEAVSKVGGRSVMKAVIPGLLHKSEAGGVALDINIQSASETYERLSRLGPDKSKSNKVLVETFVPKGVEALVGITSSSLGKVLTIGVGGILTEVISDVAVRLLPVDSKIVNEMIDETRLAILFSGVRGAAASNRDAFVDTVLRITDAVIDWPSGCELDINPLTVLPEGAWVLDSAYSPPALTSERSNH
jgi:acyl-CoA synthetase (NDP forming)